MIYDHHCHIIENIQCGHNLFRLRLKPVNGTFQCHPGQFVMIDLPDNRFFFRRPMSVMQCFEDGQFDIFYKVMGQGTQMLSMLNHADKVTLNVLGPLGNTFKPISSTTTPNPDTMLLVGGGIGIAPLYFLGTQLKATTGKAPHCIYGVRNAEDFGVLERLSLVFENRLHLTTDDGSQPASLPDGATLSKGNVCDVFEEYKNTFHDIDYAAICGPTPMMYFAQQQLHTHNPNTIIDVSLEEHMPCGTGACTGCVVFRCDGKLPSKTCVEGPVFDAGVLAWDGFAPTASNSAEATSCQH